MPKPKHIHEAKLTKGQLPQTRSALLARIKEIKQATWGGLKGWRTHVFGKGGSGIGSVS